ncbi:MAG: phytanoyl-CoA dioxygenase family protein [Desulfurellaceae bacterium]|nr:phytanoyl-CoA dioxygenase family protein [Desulfurellaceae bacterium]
MDPSVIRHMELLPGVPIVDSPFFEEILASSYFCDWERQTAASLYRKGYAVLDYPDPDISVQAQRIRDSLAPLFEAARQGGEKFDGRLQPPRFHDAFHINDDVAAIATNETLLALLSKLYGRRAFPFQTLNFERGSQQHFHTDAVHFHSWPERFMCGVWVALEDVTMKNGPLCYYPGSHKWADYSNEHTTALRRDLSKPASQAISLKLWEELVAAHRCEKEVFLAKRGQALIWSAYLLHGGEKILDQTMTRWSQVSHYFFENCAYYTPMASHVIAGKIALYDPVNVCTRQSVSSSYAGRPLPSEYVAQCQQRMLLAPDEIPAYRLPGDFDGARYLTLHPDVAEAGVDPAYHYMTHGRFEGREYK